MREIKHAVQMTDTRNVYKFSRELFSRSKQFTV